MKTGLVRDEGLRDLSEAVWSSRKGKRQQNYCNLKLEKMKQVGEILRRR